MARAFNSLERVIDLESQQGYQDKAVVGGIRQFAVFWVGQAREEAVDEADIALVEQIADVLANYSNLSGVEARAKAIDGLKNKLNARKDRSDERPIIKEPAPPPSKPRQQAKVEQAKTESIEIEVEDEVLEPDPEGLRQPVTVLKGVGPKAAGLLGELGVTTILDLLYTFPRRYDDYTLLKPISRLVLGEQVTIIGTVWETRARRTKNVKLVQSVISDGTGSVDATWFNQPWLVDKIKAGTQIVLSGKVDQFLGRPIFQNPDWELLDMEPLRTRRIVPVYPLTQGLTAQKMREMTKKAVNEWAPRLPEPLPAALRKRQNFFSLPKAIQQTHYPDSQSSLHEARKRLIFDELFFLQLGMLGFRRDWQSAPGAPIPVDEDILNQFYVALPYTLTESQQRVIGEILADMAKPVPMNRLLQGDVGAGKTVVAAAAILSTVNAGLQAALMAPTEILAEQHFQGLQEMLGGLGIDITLLTGSTPQAEKKAVCEAISDGTVELIVGTHALIQEGVQFKKLGLAVIDEQHRFGVDQRKALRDKGIASSNGSPQHNPHLLVMSATPIPRTLALSLYGDLDLSILDEMPPGRQEIKTAWLKKSERERAYTFVRSQIEQGRQAFVICPLVEESDKVEAKAAVEEYERLQRKIFPDLRLGLMHGRLKADEKESVMQAFNAGEIDILVSTSVIEVGIDVPNSTIMLVEGANRFGLAQLHQFRGRVGRGEHKSYCLLIADSPSEEAQDRLSALEKTNDGFILAEKDLELRGPGEFLGRRQSGLPELHLASLTDIKMLELAREEAQQIFAADPYLEQPDHEQLHAQVIEFWEAAADIS